MVGPWLVLIRFVGTGFGTGQGLLSSSVDLQGVQHCRRNRFESLYRKELLGYGGPPYTMNRGLGYPARASLKKSPRRFIPNFEGRFVEINR